MLFCTAKDASQYSILPQTENSPWNIHLRNIVAILSPIIKNNIGRISTKVSPLPFKKYYIQHKFVAYGTLVLHLKKWTTSLPPRDSMHMLQCTD